jgi:hypothetical protein
MTHRFCRRLLFLFLFVVLGSFLWFIMPHFDTEEETRPNMTELLNNKTEEVLRALQDRAEVRHAQKAC